MSDNPPCKFCGSENIRRSGHTILSNPYRRVQKYQCKDCGRHFYNDPLKQPEEETVKCQTTGSGT